MNLPTTAEARIDMLEAAHVLRPAYAQLIWNEEQATFAQIANTTVVPGALETEAYARAVVGGSGWPFSPQAVDALVAVKLARGESLVGTEAPADRFVQVLVGEAALRNEVAGREAQRQQLEHLGQVATRWLAKAEDGAAEDEQSWLRVVPFRAGVVADAMMLMKGPDGHSLYVESRHFAESWKGNLRTRRAQNALTDLRTMDAAALSPLKSLEMIQDIQHQLQ